MGDNTTVITDLSHATECVNAARVAELALREEYATPPTYRQPGHTARVADLHRSSKFNLKMAEVTALIAIAEALQITPEQPTGPIRFKGPDGSLGEPVRRLDGSYVGGNQ